VKKLTNMPAGMIAWVPMMLATVGDADPAVSTKCWRVHFLGRKQAITTLSTAATKLIH
jgi:hypothetical protein